MPMSKEFEDRLHPVLPSIVEHFGTPFHLYDAAGIVGRIKRLKHAFHGFPDFNNFYAVKANPNPAILQIMHDAGFGFDCSSMPELILARKAGASPKQIMFTSNNTSDEEFAMALANGGCILNLDDISLIDKVPKPFPELVCFRYNPGPHRAELKSVMGTPETAKYGVPHEQVVKAYHLAKQQGAKRFGLHTMVVSNERNHVCMVDTVKMLLEIAKLLYNRLGIELEFINMGGGLGIPYHSQDERLDVKTMATKIGQSFLAFREVYHGNAPALFMESGRWITGPHGVLVTQCINTKDGYHHFRGVDATCTSSMMRPAMYHDDNNPKSGYHHITVHGKQFAPTEMVNVTGSVCEDCERFGWNRELPTIVPGDTVMIHDTGAHCHAMASNYNGRLRPQELLLRQDGSVELIRRAETIKDLFTTFEFEPMVLRP